MQKNNIVIVSDGKRTCICYNGKFYAEGITEVNFRHKAGEAVKNSFTSDTLPLEEDKCWGEADFRNFFDKVLRNE